MIITISQNAKAIIGVLVVAAGYLAGVITGDEGFGDVTVNEWLVGVGVVFGGGYLVWRVPNRPAGSGAE